MQIVDGSLVEFFSTIHPPFRTQVIPVRIRELFEWY